jgi:hypothetical protein
VKLTKLRSWLPKNRDRDLFYAPKYSQDTEALKACELDFQVFTEQVYQTQEIDSETLSRLTQELSETLISLHPLWFVLS